MEDKSVAKIRAGLSRRKISRRKLLKGAGAAAGLAAGAGAITGFPTIWAQNIKDITLLQVGGSYSSIIDIARQATKDLGFKIEMQNLASDALVNRIATQPESLDIADIEYWMQTKLAPRGVLQGVDLKKFKYWDKVVPIFTKGEYPDGRKVSDQGILPYEVQYLEAQDGTSFAKGPTEWASGIPTVFNADTLGHPARCLTRPIETGRSFSIPSSRARRRSSTARDRRHGCGTGPRVARRHQIWRQGQHDQGRDRQNHQDHDRRQEGRPFPRVLDHFRPVGKPDGLGRGGDPVDVVAGGDRGALARTSDCYYVPLKEGYRGWFGGLRADGASQRSEARCAYEYINWYQSGWQGGFIAKQGYYSAVPETAKKFMTEDEWDYWYDGKPAASRHQGSLRHIWRRTERVRDGGAIWDRMGNIACWNTVMDEDRYLTRRWNEFISS